MSTRLPISEGQEIVLNGLEGECDVSSFRNAIINGTLRPFTNAKVMNSLKIVATTLHEQMRLNPDFYSRVCHTVKSLELLLTNQVRTGDSPMAWFLCAVHRKIPPRNSQANSSGSASTYAPIEFLSSMPPWYKDADLSSSATKDDDKLPDFDDKDMLPLCYWEGLYYAAVAETFVFYGATQSRYPNISERQTLVLHVEGVDGYNKGRVTPSQLMKVLETCWDMLMNPLLTTVLDFAVKQNAAWLDKGDIPTLDEVMIERGLVEINSMSWGHIIRMLAEKHAQDVKLAVRSSVADIPLMPSLKEATEICYAGLLRTDVQTDEGDVFVDTNVTPRRRPLLDSYSSSSGQGLSQGRLDPALRDAKISAKPSAQYMATPETQPADLVHESFPSLQSLPTHPIYRSQTSSSNEGMHRFPSFDDSRPLPLLPAQAQTKGVDVEDTENMPTLRRTRATIRPRTSPSDPPPEHTGALRSNTAPTGPVPFFAAAPVPFGQRSDPLNPVPRTSAEQRYVPAGGFRPLHEREVMNAYFLPPIDAEENKTFSAKKEELFAQIDSKEQAEHLSRVERARKSDVSRESGRERGILRRIFSKNQSENQ